MPGDFHACHPRERSARRLQLVDFPELWAHRELLWMLCVRDLQDRYRQPFLCVECCLLQPLTSMAIFQVVLLASLAN